MRVNIEIEELANGHIVRLQDHGMAPIGGGDVAPRPIFVPRDGHLEAEIGTFALAALQYVAAVQERWAAERELEKRRYGTLGNSALPPGFRGSEDERTHGDDSAINDEPPEEDMSVQAQAQLLREGGQQ